MKKMTVIRQMSFGQYIQARWALENPEQYKAGLMLDISIYKQEQLDITDKRRFYITQDQRNLLDDFCNRFVVKNKTKELLATLEKDPRYVTKPEGSTFRFKEDDRVTPIAANSVITANPTTPTPMSKDDIAEARKGIDGNKPVMPVYSDMERWSLALQLDKTKMDNDTIDYNNFFNTINMSDYLFIKNMNEIADTMEKIDWKVLFYMLETGKVGVVEAKLVIEHFGATSFADKEPRQFLYLGIPDFYKDDSTIVAAMIKAEDYSCKYELALQDPEPTSEDILKRFKEYALRNRFTKILNQDLFSDPITDQIKSIKGKKVVLQSEEQDDPYTNEYTYVDQSMMINDFICFEKAFKLDPNKVYDVFGTKMSINGYIEQLYQEYPHGFNDDFYRTRIEAYNAGAAQICDL